jgi:hypothetical protein
VPGTVQRPAPGMPEGLLNKGGAALTVRRLHQATFRERVLNAYRETCAVANASSTLSAAPCGASFPDRTPHR